ncbi:hypothetical protein KR018_004241 [Drosophila ironensis]|nr:hypothetical protein KR018_004241 [Drosophila ironensis]
MSSWDPETESGVNIMPTTIQVAVRVSPCSGGTGQWLQCDDRSLRMEGSHEIFVLDYVFNAQANNQEVFDRMAKRIVHSCIKGYNGTIFTYGQSASGKTFTMMGDAHNPGILPLAVKELFKGLNNVEEERDFLLRVSYVEVYNEKIYDLLTKKNTDLKMMDVGNGLVNLHCDELIVANEEDLLSTLSRGHRERSSHSNAVIRVIVESRKSDGCRKMTVRNSVLSLLDLCATGTTNTKSLVFLSTVIKNLSDPVPEHVGSKYVNFRDSKVTRLLQSSLSGKAHIAIICTIKPQSVEETSSTVRFGELATQIPTKPDINVLPFEDTMMFRLEGEIRQYKRQLADELFRDESPHKIQELQSCIKRHSLYIISTASLPGFEKRKRRRAALAEKNTDPDASHENESGGERRLPGFIGSMAGSQEDASVRERRLPTTSGASSAPMEDRRLPQMIRASSDALQEPASARDRRSPQVTRASRAAKNSPKRQSSNLYQMPKRSLTYNNLTGSRGTVARSRSSSQRSVAGSAPSDYDNLLRDNKELTERNDRSAATIHRYVEAVEQLQIENKELTETNEGSVATIQRYEEEVEQLQRDNKELTETNERSAATVQRYEEEVEQLQRDNKELTETNKRSAATIQRYEEAVEKLQRDIKELTETNKRSAATIQRYEKAVKQLQRDNKELTETNERSAATIQRYEEAVKQLERDNKELTETNERSAATIRRYEEAVEQLQIENKELTETNEGSAATIRRYEEAVEQLQRDKKVLTKTNEKSAATIESNKEELEQLHRLITQRTTEKRNLLAQGKTTEMEMLKKMQQKNVTIRLLEKSLNELSADILSQSQDREVRSVCPALETSCERICAQCQQLEQLLSVSDGRSLEIASKCDQLRSKIAALRSHLESVHSEFSSASSEGTQKTNDCNRLQGKYNCLEQHSNVAMNTMKEDYANIRLKYEKLQKDYEEAIAAGQRCHTLEADNSRLLDEIGRLKQRVKDAENRLKSETELTPEKETLNLKLVELQIRIANLEKEHESLSNRMLDSVQENDALKAELKRQTSNFDLIEQEKKQQNLLVLKLQDKIRLKDSELLALMHMHEMYEEKANLVSSLERQIERMNEDCQDRSLKDNTLYESCINDNTFTAEENAEEAATIKAKVYLQMDLDNQVAETFSNNSRLAGLRRMILALRDSRLSLESKLMDKQQKLNRQDAELARNAALIAQLQESITIMNVRSENLEKLFIDFQSKEEAQSNISESENKEQILQLKKKLESAEKDLNEKTEEANNLKLEYIKKMEASEIESRVHFQDELSKWETIRKEYETRGTALMQELMETREKSSDYEKKLEMMKGTLEGKVREAENMLAMNQNELETANKSLKLRLEELAQEKHLGIVLKEQLGQAQEDREKLSEKVDELEKTHVNEERNLRKLESLYKESESLVKQLQTQLQTVQAFELQTKCQKLVLDVDTLIHEKAILQSQIDEANSREMNLSKRLMELDTDMEAVKKQNDLEKSALLDKIETLKAKLNDMQDMFDNANQKAQKYDGLMSNIEKLKDSLSSKTEQISELEEKMSHLNSTIKMFEQTISSKDVELDLLRKEQQVMQEKKEEADLEQTALVIQLEESADEQSGQNATFEKMISDLHGSIHELSYKLETMNATKEKLNSENYALQKKLAQCQDLQSQLEEERKLIGQLKQSQSLLTQQLQAKDAEVSQWQDLQSQLEEERKLIGQLKQSQSLLTQQLQAKDAESMQLNFDLERERQIGIKISNECNNLREKLKSKSEASSKLKKAQELIAQLKSSQANFEEKLLEKESELGQKIQQFNHDMEVCRKRCNEMENQIKEYEIKNKHLGAENSRMLINTWGLERQLSELTHKSLRQEGLAKDLEVANQKFLELQSRHHVSENIIESLRAKEVVYHTEKERLGGTVVSLLQDKRNLEEDVSALNDIIEKLKNEAAFNRQPTTPKAIPSASNDSNVRASSLVHSSSQVRKNRRKDAYDENRMQSGWEKSLESQGLGQNRQHQ